MYMDITFRDINHLFCNFTPRTIAIRLERNTCQMIKFVSIKERWKWENITMSLLSELALWVCQLDTI